MRTTALTLFILLVGLTLTASALDATQTDWSGGDGVLGPVTDWGNQFSASWTMNWSRPGELSPIYTPEKFLVSDAAAGVDFVLFVDVDEDDDLDILSVSETAGVVLWWENADGTGTSWTENTILSSYSGVQHLDATDVDGDGDLDVFYVTALMFNGYVGWIENVDGAGTTWTNHSIAGLGAGTSVSAADVDGDDDVDVFVTDGKNHTVNWFSNDNGDGSAWTSHTVGVDFTGAEHVCAADVDGDTDLDAVAAARTLNEVAWWSNDDGAGTTWTKHAVASDFEGASSVFAADVDGDSDKDILAAALVGDRVAWWSNDNGDGTAWTEHAVSDDFNGANAVLAVDMEGDSDADIVACGIGGNTVAWWENTDGSGLHLVEYVQSDDFRGAWYVSAGDVNGDGLCDIVGGASFDNEVAWWSAFVYNSSGRLNSSILDVTGETEWGWVLWDAATPTGTSVVLSVRASDDSGNMGSWSDVVWGADLGNVFPTMRGYLQYRVDLITTNPNVAPILASLGVCPYFHLLSPANGSVVDTLTPTLDWGDTVVPDFDTYTLWWGTDPAFGVYNEVPNIIDSTYLIDSGIADGDVIYWRVKAVDSSAHEFWAPEQNWSFTVDLGGGVDLVALGADLSDGGVLVTWRFEGEELGGVRVLREVDGEITPLHRDGLPGTATRFLDRDAEPDVEYRYWLEATTADGVVSRFGPTEAVTVSGEKPELVLYAAYPNPSRERINFVFSLPADGRVALSVYDLSGRRVATLLDSELTAGRHEASWNCAEIPPGVYLYRLETSAGSLTQRLVVSR